MNLGTYLVALKIEMNGLEKESIHLIDAASEDDAGRKALVAECHGDFEEDTALWEGDSVEDLGEYNYFIKNITRVDEQDINTLKRYLRRW